MKTGIELITEERKRHFEVEGWTPEHDAKHTYGELAIAGAWYALTENVRHYIKSIGVSIWPFELKWFKPTPNDRIRELAKAGALIAAEIDRLQKLKESTNPHK